MYTHTHLFLTFILKGSEKIIDRIVKQMWQNDKEKNFWSVRNIFITSTESQAFIYPQSHQMPL